MLNNCEAKGLGCVLTLPIYRGREQHGNGREAGDKGTGSGRVRYGRREVLTPLSPPPPPTEYTTIEIDRSSANEYTIDGMKRTAKRSHTDSKGKRCENHA